MKVQWNWAACAAGGFAVAAGTAGSARADDKPAAPSQVQQQIEQGKDVLKKNVGEANEAVQNAAPKTPTPEQMAQWQAQSDAMMAAMKTNEQHKALEKFAGIWDVKSKVWMMPGAPAQEATGQAESKMDFGGRFLCMTYKSEIMGQPFEGRLVMGYSNNAKQYEGVWLDNMSTSLWNSTGTASSDGNTFTWTGTMVEPNGEKNATREVTTFKGPDTYTSEFFETGKDGKENKTMELTYTRKAATPAMKPAGAKPIEPSK